MAIRLRRCTVDDAPMLAEMGARLFTETYGPTHPEPGRSAYLARAFALDGLRRAIESDDAEILVAEDEGEPVGYSFLRDSPMPPAGVSGKKAIEILRFYVDGKTQGRGIGAMLMQESLDIARRRGADVVWLQTWKEASWAVGFYEHLGFTIVGSAPFYFGDQVAEDHILMLPIGDSN
ncbi:MAG TPA: GNAT family N-acetyltransferase [Gemmatimonadaceae bacterium]|nr:GNAT family N-acetyltransferase [Gemmatimonadaceae bacterium]